MATGLQGMDIDGGTNCASYFGSKAEQLTSISGELKKSLTSFQWLGADADRVRGTEFTEVDNLLKNAAGKLNEFKAKLMGHVTDQTNASAK